MKLKQLAFLTLATALLSSCASKRDTLSYFQDIQSENFSTAIDLSTIEPKIEPFDELNITVSSLQPGLTTQYNLPYTNPAMSSSGFVSQSLVQQATYFVTEKGDITMPVLGEIHVAGMTTDQLAKVIEEKVAVEVKDPVVIVNLVNFKINVGGEVNAPGQYSIGGKRVSILDALSQAGDLTPYGERSKVMIIREEDGKRVAHTVDLSSSDILTSPYFYLKQNDYVYVAPNPIRNENAKYNQNNAYKLSVISTVVSAASVVATLIIALSIK